MRKLEKNWRQKTLETLEKECWSEPSYDSYLVRRTHQIRKLPLTDLTSDDIAMMLRQKFSLDYIVPLAIDKLEADILAHGNDGSAGAIMDAMVAISADFWKENKGHWKRVKKLLDDHAEVWAFRRDYFDNANPD